MKKERKNKRKRRDILRLPDGCIIEEGIIDYADAPLAEVLSELFQRLSIDGEPEAFIIGGDRPITETCYKRMWDRIEKTINMHGATAHVLRHTYATMAAGTGIDPKTLQSIMGHADIQTTMNRYAHKRMDKIEEAKETLKTMYL